MPSSNGRIPACVAGCAPGGDKVSLPILGFRYGSWPGPWLELFINIVCHGAHKEMGHGIPPGAGEKHCVPMVLRDIRQPQHRTPSPPGWISRGQAPEASFGKISSVRVGGERPLAMIVNLVHTTIMMRSNGEVTAKFR